MTSPLALTPLAFQPLMGPSLPTSPISLVDSPIPSPTPHSSLPQPLPTSCFATVRASSLDHFLQHKRKHTSKAVRAYLDQIVQCTQSLGVSCDTEALTIDDKSWDWWMNRDMRRITKRIRTEWGDNRYQQTKQLCTTLRKLDKLLNGRPSTKDSVKKTSSIPSANTPPLSNLPLLLRIQLHRLCLQWWKRRCREQQGEGMDCPEQWRNDSCFATGESIQDIPSRYHITYCSNGGSSNTIRDDWYVFDVRILSRNGILKNPYTNESFPNSFIVFYKKRANHLKHLGYSLATEWDEPKPSPKRKVTEESLRQQMMAVVTELHRFGYVVTVDMMAALTDTHLAKWYFQCYDIWSYRLGLTSAQQREIVPTGQVFTHHMTIHPLRWRIRHTPMQLREEVWKTMLTLLTAGTLSHQRASGANYVMMALTLCASSFREGYPDLAEAAAL